MAGRSQPRLIVAQSPEGLESAVRERCLSLLSQQPRTRSELERSLKRAGAPADVVDSVLDRFTNVGLIDDQAYAEAYVRTGIGVRRRGPRSLRLELAGRGVAPELIETATADIDLDAEREIALALLGRRAVAMRRLAPEVRRRRLTGLLLRRGFSGSVVSAVVAEVLATDAAEVADEADGADAVDDLDFDAIGDGD